MNFQKKPIVSIDTLSREEIDHILDKSGHFKARPQQDLLKGKILATCFFEPSTRTRLSFEAAMHRLGGSVIGFDEPSKTSAAKGESLQDTMRMIEHYADVIVIRHPLDGSAQLAAESVNIPVINAGDGVHQHPTQTLLDLFTIRECQGKLDGLNIALVGDLKHGRTVHSLAKAFTHYKPRLYFVAPSGLKMPKDACDELREKGIKFSYHEKVEEIVGKVDILYMVRIQEERFVDRLEYERLRGSYAITSETLSKAQPHLKVLHPLPRQSEIHTSVDSTPHAYYFQQAENGLYVRQALLNLVLQG